MDSKNRVQREKNNNNSGTKSGSVRVQNQNCISWREDVTLRYYSYICQHVRVKRISFILIANKVETNVLFNCLEPEPKEVKECLETEENIDRLLTFQSRTYG